MAFQEPLQLLRYHNIDLLPRMTDLVHQCVQQKLFLLWTQDQQFSYNQTRLFSNSLDLAGRELLNIILTGKNGELPTCPATTIR